MLWCGTFQLAWNEACALVGEDIAFGSPSPVAEALNRKAFTKEDLDDASYFALAGFRREDVFGKIRQGMSAKFGSRARPRLVPSKTAAPRPQDIVAYAYLFKNLEFASPFAKLDRMEFGGHRVLCFGFEGGKPDVGPLCAQVLIHDYKNPDDFVIELKSKATEDRLILAKVRPAGSLAATVSAVRQRAARQDPPCAFRDDILKAPKLNFDLTRRYAEVERQPLALRRPAALRDLQITDALQNIRFQMDEKGVVLRSESHMIFACSAPHVPQPQHILIFDQPFLILLERRAARSPYFALWVDTPELLVR